MDVTVREARREDTPVLRRLMQLYLYDLGTIDGWDIGDDGLYGSEARIESFWTDPKRRSFLIDGIRDPACRPRQRDRDEHAEPPRGAQRVRPRDAPRDARRARRDRGRSDRPGGGPDGSGRPLLLGRRREDDADAPHRGRG